MAARSRWRSIPLGAAVIACTLAIALVVWSTPTVAQQPPHVQVVAIDAAGGLPPALDINAMGSVSSATDVPLPPIEPAVAAAAKEDAAAPSEPAEPLVPFDLSLHRSAGGALLDYARWHNRTMADTSACKETDVLVWSAAAGFGDSVNALTSAFRYAVGTSRLFFIRWQSRNEAHLWRIGLVEPGFAWDYDEAVEAFPHCQLSVDALYEQAAHSRRAAAAAALATGADGGAQQHSSVRIAAISGSITSDHPLAGSLDALYKDHRHVIYGLGDATLQDYLLRPNAVLDQWIRKVRLQLKRRRPKSFEGVVGLQLRSGYADAALESQRPPNANFLAPGDERLFLDRLDSIVQTQCGGHANRTRVFLMTDSPMLREAVTAAVAERYGSSMQVVTTVDGPVAHCGPGRHVSREALLRMLTDWFVFKRHADFAVITAWSLFGASACEGKNENQIWRIDASNCGQPGAKPCQMS